MAIYIIEGKLGSGKTYFAVYSLLKKYFDYDDVIRDYIPKKNVSIITNIAGLKLDHISLSYEIEKSGLLGVFSESYINNIRSQAGCRSVIFIIDEAQNYFDRKFYNKDVFFFFQYSRHYGVDIYLITQDIDTLAKELRSLAEYCIHAVSRSFGTKNSFSYKYIANDEKLFSKVITKDLKVFNAYNSFRFEETEKPRPVYLRYVAFFAVLAFVSVLSFKFLFYDSFMSRGKPSNLKSVKTPSVPNPNKSHVIVKEYPQNPKTFVNVRPSVPAPVLNYKIIGNVLDPSGVQYEIIQKDDGKVYIAKDSVPLLPLSSFLSINKPQLDSQVEESVKGSGYVYSFYIKGDPLPYPAPYYPAGVVASSLAKPQDSLVSGDLVVNDIK